MSIFTTSHTSTVTMAENISGKYSRLEPADDKVDFVVK